MWVLLSGGLRRWIIFSLAVPIAARLLGAAGHRLEARNGPTHLSRGLQGAERLASAKGGQAKGGQAKSGQAKSRDAKSRDNGTTDTTSRGSGKARRSLRRWNR